MPTIVDEPYEKLAAYIVSHANFAAIRAALSRYGFGVDPFGASAYPVLSWRNITRRKNPLIDVRKHGYLRDRVVFDLYGPDADLLDYLAHLIDEAFEPLFQAPAAYLDATHWKCHSFAGSDSWQAIDWPKQASDGRMLKQRSTDFFYSYLLRENVA
jgi:hypothetical protein